MTTKAPTVLVRQRFVQIASATPFADLFLNQAFYQFHAQKPCLKFQNLKHDFFWIENTPRHALPLEVFRKFIRFDTQTRPFHLW